jgi:2-polyprenyl-3-methyl-5-hydroxy-6-metoxy-1,4-benzoquinol methylase
MSVTSSYDRVAQHLYGRARSLIAPEVRNSHYSYAERLRDALTGSGRWLDIGCGHDFLPPWMAESDRLLDVRRWTVVGIDMDRSAIARHPGLRHRVVGNGEQLPFESNTFDLITANMVVEHVADPAQLFLEISRVLAPGGRIVVHTPNVRGYTTTVTRLLPEFAIAPLAKWLLARAPSDVYRTYYRANSTTDLQALAERHGLLLESCELLNSSAQTARLPPLMVFELLLMRMLRARRMAQFRACLLAVIKKPPAASAPAAASGQTPLPAHAVNY